MSKNIFIHIGTHKTGSTSLQDYLSSNRLSLISNGICYYSGDLLLDNHIELYLSCIDREKDSLAQRTIDMVPLDILFDKTRAKVSEFLTDCQAETIIFSTEGLSLLRTDMEMSRLAQIFDPSANNINIICVLRNKADYLSAYRKQILKVPRRKPSDDPRSALYVEPDSWLIDYDKLLEAYRIAFGTQSVHVIDYDIEVTKCGDVLPASLRALSIPESLLPKPGYAKRSNTTSKINRTRQLANRLRDYILRNYK